MSLRAKLYVAGVTFTDAPDRSTANRVYTIRAAETDDESNPAKIRWAELEVSVQHPLAQLKVGHYYYLDFSEVDE